MDPLRPPASPARASLPDEPPERARGTSLLRPALGSVGAGLLLGPLDLWAQTTVPYPWADLANSGAVWAAGAFALGRWCRRSAPSSALAGMVMLLLAVQSYYLADVLLRHSSAATLGNSTTRLWLCLAVVVGLGFGGAGHLSRSTRAWVRSVAAGTLGLVFLLEACHTLLRSRDGGAWADDLQTAVVELVLALALPAAILLAAPRSRRPSGGADGAQPSNAST